MKVYPSWRYHATEQPRIVDSPQHELEVADPQDGWADTPAAFLEDGKDADEAPAPPAKAKRK